ncbi:MAG: hypothetical protein AB1813_21750, partial [Verrucomicrobiota bacterium]
MAALFGTAGFDASCFGWVGKFEIAFANSQAAGKGTREVIQRTREVIQGTWELVQRARELVQRAREVIQGAREAVLGAFWSAVASAKAR